MSVARRALVNCTKILADERTDARRAMVGIVDRLRIQTVQSTRIGPVLIRVAQCSWQFPFRFRDNILSCVDAANVFIARGMKNGYASDRGKIRARIAVASQLDEIELLGGSARLLRDRIDDHVNDFTPGDMRLPIGIGRILVGFVHGGFHAGHQLIEHRGEISYDAVGENVVSNVARLRSTRIVVDQRVVLDQIVQFDLGIATDAASEGMNEYALDGGRVLLDERIAVDLVVPAECGAQREKRGVVVLDLQHSI